MKLAPSQGKEAQASVEGQAFVFIALACLNHLLQAMAFTAEGIAIV